MSLLLYCTFLPVTENLVGGMLLAMTGTVTMASRGSSAGGVAVAGTRVTQQHM